MDKYVVYKLTFSDGKTYIGQAKMPVEERWKNGEGYKGQDVYVPITLEGWNNVKKEILHTDLTLEQANNLEKHYIQKFNSIKNGYNRHMGGNNDKPKTIEINIPLNDKEFLELIPRLTFIFTYTELQLIFYLYSFNHHTITLVPSQIIKEYHLGDRSCHTAIRNFIATNLFRAKNNIYIFDLDLSLTNNLIK